MGGRVKKFIPECAHWIPPEVPVLAWPPWLQRVLPFQAATCTRNHLHKKDWLYDIRTATDLGLHGHSLVLTAEASIHVSFTGVIILFIFLQHLSSSASQALTLQALSLWLSFRSHGAQVWQGAELRCSSGRSFACPGGRITTPSSRSLTS